MNRNQYIESKQYTQTCPNCGESGISHFRDLCPKCYAPVIVGEKADAIRKSYGKVDVFSLKYHNFLIKCGLFIYAALYLCLGINLMAFSRISLIPPNRTVTLICGIIMVFCAIAAVVSRFFMAAWKKVGPNIYISTRIIGSLAHFLGIGFSIGKILVNFVDLLQKNIAAHYLGIVKAIFPKISPDIQDAAAELCSIIEISPYAGLLFAFVFTAFLLEIVYYRKRIRHRFCRIYWRRKTSENIKELSQNT